MIRRLWRGFRRAIRAALWRRRLRHLERSYGVELVFQGSRPQFRRRDADELAVEAKLRLREAKQRYGFAPDAGRES